MYISCFMQTIGTEICGTLTSSLIHTRHFSNATCTMRHSHCVLMNNAGLGFLWNVSHEKFQFSLSSRTIQWFGFPTFRNFSLSKIASRINLPLCLNWRCTKWDICLCFVTIYADLFQSYSQSFYSQTGRRYSCE